MPKLKTHSGAKKRFNLTKTGKVKRAHAYKSHILTKKEKDAKKNQRVIEIKEIRMSPGIGDNDFNTKLKNGQKFLNDGNRVKVSVRFRGREMAHTDIGEVLLRNFAEKCADIANLDKAPKLEGRNMSMFLSPKPQTPPKKPAKPKVPKTGESAE